MKKIILMGWIGFFSISFLPAFSQTVVINEIVSSNNAINTDEDNSYEDWIEIYNNGSQTANLENFGLTDNPAQPFKWVFPNIELVPQQHLLIWCSDKNRNNPNLPLHTNFKISADGETIVLTRPDGTTQDLVPAIAFPQNQSYGRSPSGATVFAVFTVPTPGTQNGSATPQEVSAPEFSMASGVYENGFTLQLTHTDPEITILYTLDGSEPDAANLGGKTYLYKNQYRESSEDTDGELLTGEFRTWSYSDPLTIVDRTSEANDISTISTTYHQLPYYVPQDPNLKITTVRAKAVKEDQSSPTVTQTYFIGADAGSFTLPVVSVSVNEDAFFDYNYGMQVAGNHFDQWRDANPDVHAYFGDANYKQTGDAWQTKGNFSYFSNGSEVVNQDIDIRLNGGFSREHPGKSLRLYARSQYGNSSISYPFFGQEYPFSSFKRLLLRNSGNDWYGTYFRDAFIQRAVKHLNFDTQPYQPAVVFLNSEYWGLLNFRERYDKAYFERVYDIADDELDFLEYNGYLVQEGDFAHYSALLDYLANNSLESVQNFDYINTQMDVENFTDFYIANIYADNTDWPHNNIEFWRKKTAAFQPDAPQGQDGRWRWVLKDTDFGFSDSYDHNTLAFASSVGGDENTNPEWSTFLFRKLLENQTYRHYFINRFADLINTTYLPERLLSIIEDMKNDIAPEIPRHGERWKSMNTESWNASVNVMKNFAQQRPEVQREHIKEKFNIASGFTATLDVDDIAHGYISINTIDITGQTPGVSQQPYPWNGIYFSGIPVSIKAQAYPGFAFTHWSGASQSPNAEIIITPTSDFSLVAHYEAVAIEIPISYWLSDTSVPNDTPLQIIPSTYEISNEGNLEYTSSLPGYPYAQGHEMWRKGSLERVNAPTPINYIPQANDDIPFAQANMRGLQVRQPFQFGEAENILLFNQPTTDYEDIIVRFAAKDEGAASSMLIDYTLTSNPENWATAGLSTASLELTPEFQLYEIDFSSIPEVSNNPDFKFRLRFAGADMSADNGGRVIFNNVSISGKQLLNTTTPQRSEFHIYPNPVDEILYIGHSQQNMTYELYGLDGRKVGYGNVVRSEIDLSPISKGIYLLRLQLGSESYSTKIIKK